MNTKYIFLALGVILFIVLFLQFKDTSSTENSKKTLSSENTNQPTLISWSPRIFYYPKFASDYECDYIINLGKDKVSRSMVVGDSGGVVSTARTSYGVFLSAESEDPVMQALADRIAMWSQLPKENGEAFYLLRYENGQEYKPHNDYFPSGYYGAEGNRFATVLTYLSDVEEGGETIFPAVDLKVGPKKGDAILFWNLHPNGTVDEQSLHGGLPVTKGTKWCLTKWIRQSKFY